MMPSLSNTFGWTLLHLLWQGTAIALLAWILLVLARRLRPETRYLIAWAALALMAAMPIATFAVLRRSEPPAERVQIQEPVRPVLKGTVEARPQDGSRFLASTLPARTVRERLDAMAPNLLPFWVLGVLILVARNAGGLGWIAWARKRSRPLEDEVWAQRVEVLRRHFGLARRVGCRLLDELEGPVVAGILKPVILMPASVLTGMPVEQVEMLLAHEIAHVARHDVLANLVQRAVETLLFFHPAVWWLGARLRQERERCCDALAADLLGDPCGMAEALTSLENLRHVPALPVFAVGAGGGSLKERVRALLDLPAPIQRWRIIGAVGLLLICLGSGAALLRYRSQHLHRWGRSQGGISLQQVSGGEEFVTVQVDRATPDSVLEAYARAEAKLKGSGYNVGFEPVRPAAAPGSAPTYSVHWRSNRPDFLEYWYRLKGLPPLDCPQDTLVVRRDNLGLPWDKAEDPPLDVWVPKHATHFSAEASRLLHDALVDMRGLDPTPGQPQEVRRKLPEAVLATLKSPDPGTPVLRGWTSRQDEELLLRLGVEPFEPARGFRYEYHRLLIDLPTPGADLLRALNAAQEARNRNRNDGRLLTLSRREKELQRFDRRKRRGSASLTPQEERDLSAWREERVRLEARCAELWDQLQWICLGNARSSVRKRLSALNLPEGAKAALSESAPQLQVVVTLPDPNQPGKGYQVVVNGQMDEPDQIKKKPGREGALLQRVALALDRQASSLAVPKRRGLPAPVRK